MSFDRLASRAQSRLAVASGALLALIACNPKVERGDPPPSVSASVSTVASLPAAPAPGGPLGTVRGVVTIKGDPVPEFEGMKERIPVGKCFLAHDMYTKLFREGPGRTVADVLVAVTQFHGTATKEGPIARVEAKECAFETRTIAMSLGQTLSVQNVGKETHTPQLVGHPSPALLLAIPGGDPVEFKPNKLGQYQLIDRSHEFAFADVFVLNYSTVAVTGVDGKFEISGVPPGKAKLSALLPITGRTVERDIDVPPGRTVDIALELEFDAERDGKKAHSPPTP